MKYSVGIPKNKAIAIVDMYSSQLAIAAYVIIAINTCSYSQLYSFSVNGLAYKQQPCMYVQLLPEQALCNQMRGQPISFLILTWLVCLLLCACYSKSIKPTNHFHTLFISYLAIEYHAQHKIFLFPWAAFYFPPHHMDFLSTVS